MPISTADSTTGDIVTDSSYPQSVPITSLDTRGRCIELIVARIRIETVVLLLREPERLRCIGRMSFQ